MIIPLFISQFFFMSSYLTYFEIVVNKSPVNFLFFFFFFLIAYVTLKYLLEKEKNYVQSIICIFLNLILLYLLYIDINTISFLFFYINGIFCALNKEEDFETKKFIGR
jgi:hypothetical protein